MTALAFVLRLAWREWRGARRRLLLLTAAVAAGVAALVAVNSFTENLRVSVRGQARELLGADLAVQGRAAFTPHADSLLGDALCAGARLCGAEARRAIARVTEFSGMAYVPRTSGTRLVQVSAVAGGYPFYGAIRTDPADAWATLQAGPHVVVDPTLLTALGARVGDTLALGEGRFVITGSIRSMPGDASVRAAFGPRVFIPASRLAATKLLGFGARAEYAVYARLPTDAVQPVAERLRAAFQGDRVRVRTVSEDQRNLNDALTKLGDYLGLVALVALLLGGLGVASAVHVHVRQKQDAVAVLRCLGATAGQLVAVYLLQAALMGFVGSAAGAALGVLAQQALPRLLAGFLPVTVTPVLSWHAVGLGLALGLWVAMVFALLPLLAIRKIPPLAALRRDFEAGAPRRAAAGRPYWAWGLLAGSVVGLAVVQVGSVRAGAAFAAGVGVAIGVLALAALGLVRAVRRWFPHGWPYVWRQGLANLYRPANQTVAVVLTLGFGAFLVGTLLVVQHDLLRRLQLTGGPRRPNLVLFDIQPAQLAPLEGILREAHVPAASPVPIVPMRILSVKGRPVRELMAPPPRAGDQAGEQAGEPPRSNGWAFRREYRSTYRDTLVASERLVAGRWWTDPVSPAAPISVESGLAQELGVRVGDEIVWDVQGAPVPTRVASLREVDWARFEPNFFVVFAPGALEKAPRSYVLLTRVPDAAARGTLQRRVAERFANVTSIDLTDVERTLEQLIRRVVTAIRFLALFTLATGAVVLIGAVATSRWQRRREAVLLKTLGATRRQVARVIVAEYLALGLLAATAGLALSGAAGWALARWVFDMPFSLPLGPLAALGAGVVALTVVVGVLGSVEALRFTPLEALRESV